MSVNLLKDFPDFYDHELENYSIHSEHIMDRRTYINMDIASQLAFLSKAGFETPIFGSFETAILKYEAKHKHTLNMPQLEREKAFISHNKNGEKNLLTLTQAKNLEPSGFLVEFIPMTPGSVGSRVLSYVRFGNLYCWTLQTCIDNWRLSQSLNIKTKLVTPGVGDLNSRFLKHFNLPLFSIQFLILGSKSVAISYSTSPNLYSLGVHERYSADDVAKSIYLSTHKYTDVNKQEAFDD